MHIYYVLLGRASLNVFPTWQYLYAVRILTIEIQLFVTDECNDSYRGTSQRHVHLIWLHYENSLSRCIIIERKKKGCTHGLAIEGKKMTPWN